MPAIDILVYLESREGKIKKPSLEALGQASRMASQTGGKVHGLLLGGRARDLAPSAIGASSVLVDENDLFKSFHLEEAAGALQAAVRETGASAVFLAATSTGRELAAAAAADLKTCVAADVTDVTWSDGAFHIKRPVYAGKLILSARIRRLPAVITLRPNIFAPCEAGAAPQDIRLLEFPPVQPRARVVETVAPEAVKPDLAEADIIVSGGRGLKGPENFAILESLARTLGGAVGASRAVCDAGWRPHSEQVGQTGKTVSPKLYIACGISGAIQHLAGMSSSKHIVAINKDPNAPIFQVADYGIIGDLFEIVPALEEELKKSI